MLPKTGVGGCHFQQFNNGNLFPIENGLQLKLKAEIQQLQTEIQLAQQIKNINMLALPVAAVAATATAGGCGGEVHPFVSLRDAQHVNYAVNVNNVQGLVTTSNMRQMSLSGSDVYNVDEYGSFVSTRRNTTALAGALAGESRGQSITDQVRSSSPTATASRDFEDLDIDKHPRYRKRFKANGRNTSWRMTHSGQSISSSPSKDDYKKVHRSVCPSPDTTSVIGSNENMDQDSTLRHEDPGYSSVLYTEEDSTMLSEYQCEIRKNLEIFEAGREYVLHSRVAGRKGLIGKNCGGCGGIIIVVVCGLWNEFSHQTF